MARSGKGNPRWQAWAGLLGGYGSIGVQQVYSHASSRSTLMPWISPYSIVLVVALIALGLLVGRIRRDARRVVGLYTIGLGN